MSDGFSALELQDELTCLLVSGCQLPAGSADDAAIDAADGDGRFNRKMMIFGARKGAQGNRQIGEQLPATTKE